MAHLLIVYNGVDSITYESFGRLAVDYGWKVSVAVPDDCQASVPPVIGRHSMKPIRSKFTLSAIGSLRRLLKELRPDVVFAASTSGLSTAIFAAIGMPRIGIVGYRGTQARVHAFDPTYRMALLNPRVDHIVCETSDILEYLKAYIPDSKLSQCLKPYELAWAESAMANPVSPKNAEGINLVYVGMSAGRPYKGLRYLIDAVGLLNDRGVGVALRVIGSADQCDIDAATANVEFVGVSNEALRYIAGADVYVLPSERDASPRVLREAQACGLPCVVSDIPGARDLIVPSGEKSTGILVEPRNPEAIAVAIATLAANPEMMKRMASNARQHISENFRLDGYVAYFDSILKSVIEQRNG